jgi:hypothetical protein
MAFGPTYTKNNYCCVDNGVPYLIKVASDFNAFNGTGLAYAPALVFNIAKYTVGQFAIYVNQTTAKKVIPLYFTSFASTALITQQLSTQYFGGLSGALAWLPLLTPTLAKSGVQMAETLISACDFNSFDFIDVSAGVVFAPNTSGIAASGLNPVDGNSKYYPDIASPGFLTGVNSYTTCTYAELQQ